MGLKEGAQTSCLVPRLALANHRLQRTASEQPILSENSRSILQFHTKLPMFAIDPQSRDVRVDLQRGWYSFTVVTSLTKQLSAQGGCVRLPLLVTYGDDPPLSFRRTHGTAMISALSTLFIFSFAAGQVRAQYTATYSYDPNNQNSLPPTTQEGQEGTNRCGTGSNPTSMCQNVFLNSITDWCIWGPPYSDGHNATIGETERGEVAYCLRDGYGTRLLPDGSILGAHWVQTPDYVQITGQGDFTKIGIPKGDDGGELDPHGADGNGNPIGGLVFGSSYGTMMQFHEWTNFMSDTEFCIRACKPGPRAAQLCQHIYDVMGCGWNMPGNYETGYFESCVGDSAEPMGVYGGSTFYQGQGQTPPAHAAPSSSSCVRIASLTSFSPLPSTVTVSSSATVVTSGAQQITYLVSAPLVSSSTSTSSASASVVSSTATSSAKSGAMTAASPSGFAWTATMLTMLVGALVGAMVAL